MKEVTAKEVLAGSKKLPFYKLRLVKTRSLRFAVDAIRNVEDLAKVAKMELGNIPHEELIAIGISGAGIPLGVVRVSQGGLHSSAATAQDIIRPIIAMGAGAFVVAHNHPSGDPTPSADDVRMTDALQKAAACVGLHILDHIVIGSRGGGWRSIMHP